MNVSFPDSASGIHGSVHEHLTAEIQSAVAHEAAVANGVGRIVFCILLAATLTFGNRIGRASKGLLSQANRESDLFFSHSFYFFSSSSRYEFQDYSLCTLLVIYSQEF